MTTPLQQVTNDLATINTAVASIQAASADIASVVAAQGGAAPTPTPPVNPVPPVTPPVTPPPTSIPVYVQPPASYFVATPTPASPVTCLATPLGGGLSKLGVLSDDFRSYTSTAALLNAISTIAAGTGLIGAATTKYTDGWHGELVSLDPTVLYNGHASMKMFMPGGVQNCPMLYAELPKPLDKIYFRTKMRFSPGFTDTGTLANVANAIKILAWGHTLYDGSGRVEISNTTEYFLYWNIQLPTQLATQYNLPVGELIGGGGTSIPGRITTEWNGTAWWDYILCIDRTAVKTGLASLWFGPEGGLLTKSVTPLEAMFDGSAMPQINKIGFTIEFNQTRAATQNQQINIGQWEVIDGVANPNPYALV